MKEKLINFKNQVVQRYKELTKKQKIILFGSAIILCLASILTVFFITRTEYVPLYSNLSPQEAGQIKESLDSKGIKSELSNGGTTISVPSDVVDQLKVDLAAEGIPKSGNIDFSVFSDKSGFGMTDNEFQVLNKEATQTKLANLIKSIDGIEDATVMITMPEESVWVSDEDKKATASVVLKLKPGYNLNESQVKALYTLVSRSIPNLPVENIVITDQYSNDFDLNEHKSNSSLSTYEEEQQIKQDIEKDLQRRVQQMLGTIIGPDKVVSIVTADVDFTKEKREENLVEPVDKKKMKGLEVSVEKIRESYSGNQSNQGGVAGTGQTDIPTYPAGTNGSNGTYDKADDKINYAINKIKREIEKSPYEIRDLGIQVVVEPPKPNDPNSLPQARINDIKQLLSSVVSTSISKTAAQNLTTQQMQDKISVSVQPFHGKQATGQTNTSSLPIWVYIIGGVLLVVIILLAILLIRKKREREDMDAEIEEFDFEKERFDVPDVNIDRESEETVRKEQLEKMAKEKPEEFVKLLRTWLSED
ncbi:flagellar basal-body MS-ring/collar protein FliF [Fictibacillus gelatini]|uniref:flagellar basal-body MS-ring/collar protein FliF n=1 Tax=Fictibacillus gelatini TaxID=225985 RepID=UPI000401974D|nr:flagellar basal-body MS-ring/collar protein FliF [Fictibacillus gelatini]